MPRRDGTGPMGTGRMSGRGLGICSGVKGIKDGAGLGRGFARRCGFGRCKTAIEGSPKTQKELLQEQKDILQKRLEIIERELANL